MRLAASLLGFLFLFALPARAAPNAVVDAVQMPAWLDRAGRVTPLVPGQEMKSGDRVRTGEGARAYLKLPEGSLVKLGASAQLVFQAPPMEDSTYRAAMDVLAGAFRFTTAAVQKLRKRDVSIRVGTATIGIRGTDVWGRSGSDSDLVMLLEGRIELQPAVGEAFAMNQPNTVLTAAKGGAAMPLTVATPVEVATRARETEILSGDGAARSHGRWYLVLGSFPEQDAALAAYDLAQGKGFAVRIRPGHDASGTLQYAVVLPGFSDQAEAIAVALRLKAATGLDARPMR
jgi:hypothetical protein